MIPPLFRRPNPTIAILYGVIVAQAREPRFYEDYAVPDTVLGRFDMVVLHLVLVIRRLRDDPARAGLAQGLFDAFCRDMDHNLREMGISDQGVPKQMQRVGEAFYGRAEAYEAALAGPDDAPLAEALRRNVYAGVTEPQAALALAGYVREAAGALAGQPIEAVSAGEVRFPRPAATRVVVEEPR